jgi:CMP-2-keto-3-deoxyoctulosonic acid synthetase
VLRAGDHNLLREQPSAILPVQPARLRSTRLWGAELRHLGGGSVLVRDGRRRTFDNVLDAAHHAAEGF